MADRLRVLITGCSSGIGKATATLLAEGGHDVIATARNPADLSDIRSCERLSLDVTDPSAITKLASLVGEIDVLVNNAGRGMVTPVEHADDAAMETVWATNLLGPIRMIKAFLPSMRERGSGRIVNVSSVAGRRAMPLIGHYAATKHALEAISESLQWEVRGYGIRVVLVEPGAVSTEFSKKRLSGSPEMGPYEEIAAYAARIGSLINASAQTAREVAECVVAAVTMKDPPLRVPTSQGVAKMMADRTGRADREFEQWLFGVGNEPGPSV
ncbi:SDR family oxidoreductase [Rhodococcus opacus]|uniref:Oxidoreductase n=1 Tax=Rhodococcus opacus TaxID=37919 RepID=A0A2S8J624_RHOOP|nr:SDR family oxidoreductase [Rhodococcus opacus]PQP21982.1 oxidoreductase [Rhodococcus opacus]